VKGTKLWQAPGSPVIQGRSREQRPFLRVWAVAAAASAGTLLGLLVAYAAFPGGDAMALTDALATSLTLLMYALPGIAVGSLVGTAFARAIGTRRAWLGGWLFGVILGAATMAWLATDLILRGISFT